jgi:hypothetical protein
MLLKDASTALYTVSFDLWWRENPSVASAQVRVQGDVVIPHEEWVWLATTVSAANVTLYSSQNGKDVTAFGTAAADITAEIPSSGMFHIGRNFTGLIDNVLINVTQLGEELQQYSECPLSSVAATYRFNEKHGAWTSTSKLPANEPPFGSGEDMAQHNNNLYVANIATYGVIGLVVSSAQDGSNLTLTCPNPPGRSDVIIDHILLADLGNGTIRSNSVVFEPGTCVDARAAFSLVTQQCFGKSSCSIAVNATALQVQGLLNECNGNPTRTLSVAVACAPQSPGTVWSDESAPTRYGDLVAGDVFEMCSEEVADWLPEGTIPANWQNTFPDCNSTAVGQARATVHSYLGIYMLDKCGARHMWLAGKDRSDINATLVWTGSPKAKENSCEIGPPAEQPLQLLQQTLPTGGDEAPCKNDDVMLFKYMPLATGNAIIRITQNGEMLHETGVHVAAGPPSAQHSIISGSALVAPRAGQTATLTIEAKDAANNTLDILCGEFQERLSIEFKPEAKLDYVATNKPGFCELIVDFQQAVEHTLNITTSIEGLDSSYLFPEDRNTVIRTVKVSSGVILMANTASGVAPEGRTATAAASCSGDVVLFGGADARRSYVYDTWRFSSKRNAVFTYRTPIHVSGGEAPAEFTVGLTLDTKKMIQAGQMRNDCDDLTFVSTAGETLKYWLDPLPGCNAATTLIWLQLPNGDNATMYHGGNAPVRS